EFFLEGEDYFDFGLGDKIQPFYSRRIGLDTDGREIPILGGARILGKQGNSTIGGMSIQTAETDSVASANYSVLRWKQDVGEQSSVGLIGVGKFEPGHQNGMFGADFLYSTSSFLKDKNFSAGGAYAQSYTSGSGSTGGSSQRAFISYPSDFIEFDLSWERSGKNFNPKAGLLKRENYQVIKSELQFNPRPAFLPKMRNLVLKPLDIDYYYDDQTGRLISFEAEFRPLGFSTKSGESFELNIKRIVENLDEDFDIQDDVVISDGEYWFTHYEIQFETFTGRPVFAVYEVNWGDFYNGSRLEWFGSAVWRLNKHFSISYDLQQNIIKLPEGDFTVNEHAGRIEYAVNTNLFGAVFGQWNNEDQEAIFNFRFNWIPKPGANLYFVV
ncbi:MAG: hypothetical protein KAR38_15335, partial [Calditrichia bacterium]|nr:hypothetical protein [Calditrichia bacterium]